MQVGVRIMEVKVMNIILPNEPYSFEDGAAVVEGNILYLYRPIDFDDLMIEMSYAINGRDTCYYCGKKIHPSKLTVDHRVPACFGGPTITNNLVSACKHCNSRKGNLYEDEYWRLLDLEKNVEMATTPEEKSQAKSELDAFWTDVKEKQEERFNGSVEPLPEDWLYHGNLNVITMRYRLNDPIGTGFKRVKSRYKKSKTILRAVLVSSNKHLLSGFNVCLFAKVGSHADLVKVIVLENVVCMY